MNNVIPPFSAMLAVMILLAGCGDTARVPISAGTGSNPVLPSPVNRLVPTVNIAPAQGWLNGSKPIAVAGTTVNVFADNLDHPRWIYVLQIGRASCRERVLVAV